jgi:GNAT superfamily N-acetyltransferase
MPHQGRNDFLDGDWRLKQVDDNNLLQSFDCGDLDLNEYFQKDAVFHKKELITQTYYLEVVDQTGIPLALIDFCNDTVKLKNFQDHPDIASKKRYPFLPAVKITRFGVSKDLQNQDIGTHVMNMVKRFFVTNNRTGCRFITVDAYNNERVLRFYLANGFKPFNDKDSRRQTRSLYFDLKRLEESL